MPINKRPMKTTSLLFFCFILFGFAITAQTKTTKETKVIVVVTNDAIAVLEFFENSKTYKEKLTKKYPQSKFFMGFLKGRYELKNKLVIPKSEATITVFTNKQIFNSGELFKDKKLKQGMSITIGSAQGKIMAAKKGELVIKTNI